MTPQSMTEPRPLLDRVFRALIAARWLVVAVYALLLAPAIWFALRVDQDNSIDRLIVPSDPDSVAAREFEQVFGAGEYVLLLAEAPDPFAPAVLQRVEEIERAVSTVPKVEAQTIVS